MKRTLLSLSFLFAFIVHGSAQTPLEDELYASVVRIENRTPQSRNEFIKDQLRAMNVGFIAAPFKQDITENKVKTTVQGENIIVRIGSGEKRIVLGAHYDAVAASPGANDNGSGVAVLLSLLKHMQEVEWNYTVEFCFFDKEEAGFIGSSSYVSLFVVPKRHMVMINLDVVGTGEEVFVGPVGSDNRSIMRFVNEAAKSTGFPFTSSAEFPGSDHLSFAQSKLQNISISIVPKGDAEKLTRFIRNGYRTDSAHVPLVLGVMHTGEDKAKYISPRALTMAYEFTKTLLVLLNESGR